MFFKILSCCLFAFSSSNNQNGDLYLVNTKDGKSSLVGLNYGHIKCGKKCFSNLFEPIDDVKEGSDYSDAGHKKKAELYLHIYGRDDMIYMGNVNMFTRW